MCWERAVVPKLLVAAVKDQRSLSTLKAATTGEPLLTWGRWGARAHFFSSAKNPDTTTLFATEETRFTRVDLLAVGPRTHGDLSAP